MAWFVNLRRGVPDAARDRLLRRRLHDAAQADDAAEHRHRRRGRRAAAGDRLGGRHRRRRAPAADPVRRSSSTGRRRISGRCRCGSRRTTPRPACRCCLWSAASPRRRARSACTRSCWSRSRWSCSPSRGWARSTWSPPSSSARSSCGRRTGSGGVGTSAEASTAGAIRLYKYSISYLTLLFAGGRGRRPGGHPGLIAAALGGARRATRQPRALRASATATPARGHGATPPAEPPDGRRRPATTGRSGRSRARTRPSRGRPCRRAGSR